MKHYFLTALLVLALIFSMCSCTSREMPTETEPPAVETPEPSSGPTPKPTPEATAEPVAETEPLFRDFFTGEGLDEQDYTRPFAVMINNINVAQPQCGVGNADIIYEVLAEGGITRMMAIFSNVKDAGTIGSMRSIRTYYVDIAMAYGAVAVHAGYSEQAHSRIKSYGVNNIDGVTGSYAGTTFYRDSSRMSYGYEHSLFTTGEKLWSCAENLGYDLTVGEDYSTGLNFVKDATPEKGVDAAKIEVDYSGYKSTTFTYHEDEGTYTAFQHGNDYYDGNSGDVLNFKNVFVLSAKTKVIDSAGRLDVTLTGTGSGYYCTGGKYIEIEWSRSDLDSPFSYTLTDGTPLEVSAGRSYIGIISTTDGNVIFSE